MHCGIQFLGRKETSSFGATHPAPTFKQPEGRTSLKTVTSHSPWTANVCFKPPAAWALSPSGCRRQEAEVAPTKPNLLFPALV